jgi:hypothetical protein
MRQVIGRGTPVGRAPGSCGFTGAPGGRGRRDGLSALESSRAARAPVLAEWLDAQDPAWRAGITTASLDPFRGYATTLTAQLPDAAGVLDYPSVLAPASRPNASGARVFSNQ